MDRLGAWAVDRAGCSVWCGKRYAARGVPFRLDVPMFVVGDHIFFFDAEPVWCSARCRDLRLPPIDPKIPIADARGEGTCGPGPLTALSGSGGTPAGYTPSVRAGGLSASLANVSPPCPAPGQRWEIKLSDEWLAATIRDDGGLSWDDGTESTPGGWTLKHIAYRRDHGEARYLGPTDPATPSAVAPAPLPTAAALGSGPPKGYGPCPRKCGRWTYQNGASDPCWTCHGSLDEGANERFPDWTPPAPKPTRTPGITCRRCLLTSAGGVDHRPTCTRNDVLTADSWLTPEAWSTQVRCALERLQDEREKAARPFVPSITDEDLFGKAVRP